MKEADPTSLAAAWEAAVRQGDFAQAWQINDHVLSHPGRVPDDPRLPYHLRFVWDGRPFDDRHVLVRCYHGLGDTLQFIRYLPPLRARASSITLEAQPELIPMLAGFPGVDRVVPFRFDRPLPPSECDIEIMELPHALRLRPQALPPPYLRVAEPLIAAARRRFGPSFIGVCCRSGDWDPARSVPTPLLADILPRGLRIAKLQPGTWPGLDWANPEDTLETILDTAALVCAARLVITSDTMVAHLAGALARPVALLLKHQADWRWMDNRPDSPWYPSMRIYRQAKASCWDEPIAALAHDLPALIGIEDQN